MEDEAIVALYFRRSEDAIHESRKKYGTYCTSIAYHILASFEDTEECVADTWIRTWNAVPPARPRSLKAFLGRITRNLALDRYRAGRARKNTVMQEVLSELQIRQVEDPGDAVERKELAEAISRFLRTLPPVKQKEFMLRYWYCEPIKTISQETGLKENRITTDLYRMRKKLKAYLEQEGFQL